MVFGIDDMAVATVAAPVIGGLIGAATGNQNRDAANANANRAAEIIGAVQVPELKQWLLEQYASAGEFTPDMLQALSLDPSAQGAISTNPVERQKLVSQIDTLINASKTGNTPEDQAAYNLAIRNSAGQANAQQGAILNNMAARGVAGSGVELAMRLDAQQKENDRLQQAALEEAKNRNALRMQALEASTGALSNLRGADYQQALNAANATDAINKANVQNQQSVMNQNTSNMNDAQKFNLANRQRLADANTDTVNKQNTYNNTTLPQQNFSNQMQKATAQAGQANSQAQQQYQQASQTAGMWSGIGQGVGSILTTMNKKKDANGNEIE